MQLWVVELEGNVVGGQLAFALNQRITLWHGTATREGLARRALIVLDVEIIRDAVARGFRYFDYNTRAGIEGVMRYKRNFATTDHVIARCRYRNPLWQSLSSLTCHLPLQLRNRAMFVRQPERS
ncbi:GNAT family N-acetyltransferase [Chloroflexus sp.]|uniref:GNAT family N-acetyltransferase n=1 Tax=Chloroflexus sp. TaxID=1904827 RepID=UPI0026315470|nr:GNAT family N-acetyltransferase [uncultured Chloroflexus sp.]